MNEERSDATSPSPQALGYLIGALLSPIMIFAAIFKGAERGFLITVLLGAFAAILYVRRDIMREDYFIAVVPPLFLAQFLAAIGCPLPEVSYYRALVMPFGIAVLLVNLATIRLAEKLLARKKDGP